MLAAPAAFRRQGEHNHESEIERRRRRRAVKAAVVAAVALYCVTSPAAADGYTFTTIDVPLATFTYASGINDAGQIVGPYFNGTLAKLSYTVAAFTPRSLFRRPPAIPSLLTSTTRARLSGHT